MKLNIINNLTEQNNFVCDNAVHELQQKQIVGYPCNDPIWKQQGKSTG